jgi:glycosyltransferase involved in cell wall biosynthesis
MNRLVAKTIEENKIDLVYSKRLRSAQFVIDTKKIEGESRGISNAQSLPIIIDTTDAMSLFYERAYKNAPWHQKSLYLLECIKYKSYEKMIAKTLKRWVVCSPIDSKYLTARLPGVEVVVIPNAIDTEYFNAQSSVHSQIEPHAILLSGLMDKFVNIEAVDFLIKDIYPKIFSRFPDTKVYIVGPDPAAHIKRYASDRVVVTGYVEDIREYLSKAEVIVCPIKTGTGVRNKILQAWAMEKPIVSTSMGIAGLEGTNGRELLVADEAELFADSVCSLFTDKTLRDSLAKNGRVLVEKKYGKKTVDEKLESYIKDFSQSRSPALSDAC